MAAKDFDIDDEEAEVQTKPISRKKILFFLIPLLILIGIGVGMVSVSQNDYEDLPSGNYNILKNIVEQDGQSYEKITVFYDLPEITVGLKSYNKKERPRLSTRISLELNRVEDVKTIETLIPRIRDAVLGHTIELNVEDVKNANGLYWLKEELLYRINLLVYPVKVNSLNFKTFEITNENN